MSIQHRMTIEKYKCNWLPNEGANLTTYNIRKKKHTEKRTWQSYYDGKGMKPRTMKRTGAMNVRYKDA